MADKIAGTDGSGDVTVRGDGRRDEVVSVRLSAAVIEVLERVGAIYGMGRSQTVRYCILDWQRLKQEQEQN